MKKHGAITTRGGIGRAQGYRVPDGHDGAWCSGGWTRIVRSPTIGGHVVGAHFARGSVPGVRARLSVIVVGRRIRIRAAIPRATCRAAHSRRGAHACRPRWRPTGARNSGGASACRTPTLASETTCTLVSPGTPEREGSYDTRGCLNESYAHESSSWIPFC